MIPIEYAWSEWGKKELDELLPDKSQPIGSLIAQKGFESYREITKIYTLANKHISDLLEFGDTTEEIHLVAREYTIYKNNNILSNFIEVFRFDTESIITKSLGDFKLKREI